MIADAQFQNLTAQLQLWNRRRQMRDALIWIPRGLLAGLLLAVAVATISRFIPFLTNREVAIASLVLGIAGILGGVIYTVWRRYDLIAQARFADAQFGLQERAGAAVEIKQGTLTAPPTLAQQQFQDTIRAIQRVDATAQLPFAINRQDWALILVTIALLIAAVWLPNPQADILSGRRAVEEAIEEQIQQLEALTQEIEQNPLLTDDQKKELTEPLDSALEQLQTGDLSREQAVATLSEAEADLRDLQAENSSESLRQALQDAGDPLANNQNSASLGEALQSGNLAAASAAANALADDLSSMSQEELDELAQDLMETAQALAEVDSEIAQQLAEAAQALQDGDVAAAQQALRQAAGSLQQRAQANAGSQQAGQTANQLSESRQAVAQAGEGQLSEGQGQQGQGQQGQQGEQGQGQGQQGEGNGQQAGSGQGQGEGGGSESESGGSLEGSAGGPSRGGGHVENVYVPPAADLSGEGGVDIELPAECIANPADCGGLLSENPTDFSEADSIVPYNQVYGDYRDAAYEALADDYIPLGMKDYVRDYFSSLEP